MQTVNFNCPHCGNLMAVGMNLLGRNVRCPHCKAVVQAPTAPGEPMSSPGLVNQPVKVPESVTPPVQAPLPQFNLPPKETEAPESIFGEVHDEDLFGSEPPKPTMPPVVPPPVSSGPTVEMITPEPIQVAPPPPPSLAYNPDGPTVNMPAPELSIEEDTAPFVEAPAIPHVAPPAAPRESRRTQRPPTADSEKGSSNAFAIILLAYGLLMTIAAGVFGYMTFVKPPELDHPFKAIPDVFGEYEKANRKQTSLKWLPNAKEELPNDLKVQLGAKDADGNQLSLKIGQLEVTPLSVRVQKENIAVEQLFAGPERRRNIGQTLVLSLKVKNISDDVVFYPTDPAFVRRLEPKTDEKAGPLTALQINREMYYGTFPWPPSGNIKREFFEGQEANDQPLKPGQESTITIAVAPKQDVVRNLERVPNDLSLLWRVQLRRGLVKYQDETGRQGEFSATTVIGVTFTRKQIQ